MVLVNFYNKVKPFSNFCLPLSHYIVKMFKRLIYSVITQTIV